MTYTWSMSTGVNAARPVGLGLELGDGPWEGSLRLNPARTSLLHSRTKMGHPFYLLRGSPPRLSQRWERPVHIQPAVLPCVMGDAASSRTRRSH